MEAPLFQKLRFRHGSVTVKVSVQCRDAAKATALSEALLESATELTNSALLDLGDLVEKFRSSDEAADAPKLSKPYLVDFGDNNYLALTLELTCHAPVNMNMALAWLANRVLPQVFREAGELVTARAISDAMADQDFEKLAEQYGVLVITSRR